MTELFRKSVSILREHDPLLADHVEGMAEALRLIHERCRDSANPAAADAANISYRALAGNEATTRNDRSYPLDGRVYFRKSTAEWVLELSGVINDTAFTCRHPQPGHLSPEDIPGLPDLYRRIEALEDGDETVDEPDAPATPGM